MQTWKLFFCSKIKNFMTVKNSEQFVSINQSSPEPCVPCKQNHEKKRRFFPRKKEQEQNWKNTGEKGRNTCKRKSVRNEKARGCDELDKALDTKTKKGLKPQKKNNFREKIPSSF